MRPKDIGIVGFDQAIASHLTAPTDAFAAAKLDDGFGGHIPCYRVWTIGLTNKPVTTESGLIFQAETTLNNAPTLDTIIVAGGSGVQRPDVAMMLAEWILSRVRETPRIAAISSGIYALAPTGLLDGRVVTTHWRLASDLRRRYPNLRVDHKKRLVKDGSFYSAAGLTAGVDLALTLIEEDYGKPVAFSAAQELMTYLAPVGQPNEPSFDFETQRNDRFGELVAWIMRNLHQNLTIEVLARQACISPAHFTRAFKSVFGTTPGDFVENIRLNEARRRLSSRRKTLRSVAASVGFTNPAAFRRAFERRFGSGPGAMLEGNVMAPARFRPEAKEPTAP